MHMTKPLAMCHRSDHTLARIGARDGVAVIEYRAAVDGLRVRTDTELGDYNIDALPIDSTGCWSTYPLAHAAGEDASVSMYCHACRELYTVRILELVAAYRESRTVVVGKPEKA